MVSRIGHLVLIAGAQAAGKTTFIQDLLSQRLPREVASLLPVPGDGWSVHGAEDIAAIERAGRRVEGLVLHYDLMRWLKFKGFARDPVLGLLRQAKQVTIVTLMPSAGRLAKHHGVRHLRLAAGQETHRPVPRFSASWLFLQTMCRMPAGLRNRIARGRMVAPYWERFQTTFKSRQWHIFEGYWRRGWIEEIHDHWADHVGIEAIRATTLNLRPKKHWQNTRFKWVVDRTVPTVVRVASVS